MPEILARAAAWSDRVAASTAATSVTLDDHDRIVLTHRSGERIVTDRVVRAWFLDGAVLPPRVARTANNGAVLLEDVSGRLFLIPIDVWWMSPVSVAPADVALRSSGFQTLLDRFGTVAPPPGNFASADVLITTDERRRTRGQNLLIIVILIGLSAFLSDVFGPIVTAVPADVFGWIAAGAAAANAIAVFALAVARKHRPALSSGPKLRPVDGPSWFRDSAFIGTDDQGLVLTDGQGVTQRLATADRQLGQDAVVRAVFVHDESPRVLLIDGTNTVRAQLPLRLWAPSPDAVLVLAELLQGLGVITDTSEDLRNQPAIALDEMRNSRIGPSSLMLPNAVGAVPAYPFLASSAFTTVVLAGARSANPGAAATFVTALFAAIAVTVVTAVFVVESSSRLPVAPIRPEQHGRPDRPMATRRHLITAGVPLIGTAVAIWYLLQGNVFPAFSILFLVLAVPFISWLSFRRRRAERGRVPAGLGRWFVIGAPRGDE
jgi:hypothetical protein